jgi:hypothetical protein
MMDTDESQKIRILKAVEDLDGWRCSRAALFPGGARPEGGPVKMKKID